MKLFYLFCVLFCVLLLCAMAYVAGYNVGIERFSEFYETAASDVEPQILVPKDVAKKFIAAHKPKRGRKTRRKRGCKRGSLSLDD